MCVPKVAVMCRNSNEGHPGICMCAPPQQSPFNLTGSGCGLGLLHHLPGLGGVEKQVFGVPHQFPVLVLLSPPGAAHSGRVL